MDIFSVLRAVSASFVCVCVCVQMPQAQQGQTGPASSQASLLHMPHRQSPLHQASSSSSTSSSSSALSVGQLVSSKCPTRLTNTHKRLDQRVDADYYSLTETTSLT